MSGMACGLADHQAGSSDASSRRSYEMGSPSMRKNYVLTLTGPDRIGIVDRVTGLLLDRGGNVETSRMARLGGEFAILMLVSMPAEQFDGLEVDLEGLAVEGYKTTTTPAEQTYAEAHP